MGQTELAWEYLARAKAEPKDAGTQVALAAAVLEARHGDPALAEEALLAAAQLPIAVPEQWRVDRSRPAVTCRDNMIGSWTRLARKQRSGGGSHRRVNARTDA